MPLISDTRSLGANATIDNVLAGSQFEFLPFDAMLQFGIVGAGALGAILADVYSGQDVLMESAPISILARFPVFPDDFTLDDVAAAGERIKVRLRNTTGAAVVVNTAVKITPI
jgi:hypothetical protein